MNRSGYGLDIEAQPVVADHEEGFLASFWMHRQGSIGEAVTIGFVDDGDDATRRVDVADG